MKKTNDSLDSLRDALREKDPRLIHARAHARAVAAADAAAVIPPAGVAPLAPMVPPDPTIKVGDDTSFSRVSGAVGAMVLACLFWGIGNVVICRMLMYPDGLDKLLGSVGGFFLTGAALFAPYAVNQLRSIGSPAP